MNGQFSRKLFHLFVVMVWLLQSLVIARPASAQDSFKNSNSVYPCSGILFDFASSAQGWTAKQYSQLYGTIKPGDANLPESPMGKNGLSLDLNLNRSHPSAEFLVDLYNMPPKCASNATLEVPWWESRSALSVWVWAPKGTRGGDVFANGLHLFAIDEKGHELYGTWQNFQEEKWFEVTLNLDGGAPACGEMDSGFDFLHIRKIGINISVNNKVNSPIKNIIRISSISVKSRALSVPSSSHLYTFDETDLVSTLPMWKSLRDTEWKAEAISDIEFQNDSLLLNANFALSQGDPARKAVMGMVFSPPLNLSSLEPGQDTFSLDIKFEPPPDFQRSKCPFEIKLWAFDKQQNTTFASDSWSVGYGDWTRISFPLSEFLVLDGDLGGRKIDLSQIGQIGFQIYGNAEYQGKIWIDNIALGGVQPIQELQSSSFIKTNGPHFFLNDQRFRFIGANAEYLPIAPDAVVESVLERAQNMGLLVIRTWGFGDGCEDYHQESCTDWSRYFQPSPGVYNEAAFEHFDRIVYEAGRRNIRLIIPLANNWGEYGGIPRYVCWSQNIEEGCPGNRMSDDLHDMFYTDETIKEWYRQYVHHFVNRVNTITGVRYADDPTIMAWELINEPRAKSDPSGATLHAWIIEMSTYLAGLAPNQLIGTGEEGWYIKSQAQADQYDDWQDFPQNYWHYGVNWTQVDNGCKQAWGSNGADFLSDNSTAIRTVHWQEEVGTDQENKSVNSPVNSAERAAVPEVDFTGIHFYPAPGETNLAGAPYCEYYGLDSLCTSSEETVISSKSHQGMEWLKEHVDTAHDVLNKPFILEEINFSKLAPTNGEDPVQITPEQRARLFSQYLDMAYQLDVDGVMFWNLGYQGFAHQSWNEIPSLTAWTNDVDTKVPFNNTSGIRLDYGVRKNQSVTVMTLSDPQVEWLLAQESQTLVEVDNKGNAATLLFELQFSDGSTATPIEFSIQPGVNPLELTPLFQMEDGGQSDEQTGSALSCIETEKEPLKVAVIKITVKGYESPGNAFFQFKTIFNNKYVVYPGSAVEDVMRMAAPQWQQNILQQPSSVKIDHSLTCDTRIHPEMVNGELPVRFDLIGSIRHPDGYYYRYLIDGPENDVSGIVNIGNNFSSQIMASASEKGKYQVNIAPEGVSFDAPAADTCYFEVRNSSPTLRLVDVQVDGQSHQLPYESVKAAFSLFRINRQVNIFVSGNDDVSADLRLECTLRKDGEESDAGSIACPPNLAATTLKGAHGNPALITGELPPGHYQFQLRVYDAESGQSDMILDIDVFEPRYIQSVLVMLIMGVLMLLWRRSKTRT